MFIGLSNAVTRPQDASGLSFLFAGGEIAGYGLDLTNERYYVDRVSKSFADAVTFSRASTATYVDSTGTLQTAASGEPRIGHHVWDGSQWVNKGLLLESEARTNLLTNSEDLTAIVSTTNATITDEGDYFEIADDATDGIHIVSVPNTKDYAIDVVGVIHKPTGKVITHPKGFTYNEMAPLEGWHVNIRLLSDAMRAEVETVAATYGVTPDTPFRVFA